MTNKEERLLMKASTNIVEEDYEKLLYYSELTGHYKSRLIAIALHNELKKEKPFKLPIDMPDTFYEEFKYADQAGKILNFLRKLDTGASLDLLYMLRNKIGIPDSEEFMEAWRELIEQDILKSYLPKPKYGKVNVKNPFYTLKGNDIEAKKKKRKKATRFERYQKLKKEFENEDKENLK